jgi:pteridine reductase
MSSNPANKVALITGAAARIGAAITTELHAVGHQVAIHYRHSSDTAEALCAQLNTVRANSAFTYQADLSARNAGEQLVRQVLEKQKRLDVLINNASSYYPTPIQTATQDDWDDLFASNARAPFFIAQAAAPALRENLGCIVNLVDIYADRPNKQHPIYCMAKAANAMMVKSLAQDLAPHIRVNGVSPGAALWPANSDADAARQQVLQRIPMERPAGAEQIAAAVMFMVAGPDYVTGQILAVDGGRSVQQ